MNDNPSIGSLFAGIGGFDIGFEKAGFKTLWQVEIDPICRTVLGAHFPHAKQFADIREISAKTLAPVDAIVGGFPCQDVSLMGKRRGLNGKRTGLFFDAIRIIRALRPKFVVFENVPGLLSSNDGRDFQIVLETLAQSGYVGTWRVLDSSFYGVPTKRRRLFILASLQGYTQGLVDFMADALAVDDLSSALEAMQKNPPHNTLLAGVDGAAINLSGSNIITEENGWRAMVERERMSRDDGLRLGMDAANYTECRAAGNAITPQVSQWIAEKIIKDLKMIKKQSHPSLD